jgi:MscS family membrane protein
MTEFLAKTFYNNTIEQWSKALITALLAILFAKIIYWIISRVSKKLVSKTKGKLDDILVRSLEQPVIVGVAMWGFSIGYQFLTFQGSVEKYIEKAFFLALAINVTWLIARLVDSLIREYVIPLTEKSESNFDDQLMPILQKGTRSIIWSLGLIIGLNNAGYDVNALIAGLGIGGIALAMAAKDTISNVFGGMMVFVDKPFKIKERIKINGFDGTVVEIGLRTTRIKTLEGRIVSIPNNKFTGNEVENISLEPTRKVVLNLGLTYSTTAEKIQFAIKTLKTIAEENQHVDENYLVSFNGFNDSSLNILFIYYIKKEGDILDTQTEMSLEILSKFNAHQLDFAFPTQTIHAEILKPA